MNAWSETQERKREDHTRQLISMINTESTLDFKPKD